MLPTRQLRNARHLPLLLGDRLTAHTVDVSTGGFSVEAPFVFLPGSLLHGTFEVAGRMLPFRAEVVWAQPASQAQVPSRMGVRFTELAPEARPFLEA